MKPIFQKLHDTFNEHYPMSPEGWEEGFRRDAFPLQEIALWVHAAEVYRAHVTEAMLPEKRKDVFGVIIGCMVGGVHESAALEDAEVRAIVEAFIGPGPARQEGA